MSKTFQPTFSSAMKVTPTHSPPSTIVKDTEPFFQPTSSERTGQDFSALHQSASQLRKESSVSSERTGRGSSASLNQPSSQFRSDPKHQESSPKRTGSDFSAEKHQSASQLVSDRSRPDSSPKRTGSDSSANKHQSTDSGSPHLHRQRKDSACSCSSEAGSEVSDRPPVDLYVEEGELSDEQDMTVTEPDQIPSAKQTYRETMRGTRSYMGWTDIPDVDRSNTASDDNPLFGPKAPVPSKISVTMPTEEWLCKKLSKLNVTLTEGYPTRSTEAGGLMKDQFLRPAKSQSKWYAFHSDRKLDSSTVNHWSTDASKLNSCFSRITRQSGLTSTPPASCRLSQETLRKWEKSSREATVICNQAASFNRCRFKVQQNMQEQM